MSISNEQNDKTFTKSPAASLLLSIKNISNHSSEMCGFTKSAGLCTILVH